MNKDKFVKTLIEGEERDLENYKAELKELKAKWFNFGKENHIKFLEYYLNEKNIFINKLKLNIK